MRLVLFTAAILLAGGVLFGLGAHTAHSSPLRAVTSLSADMTAVQTAGWRRRYWRRYGVWPTGPRDAIENEIVAAPGEPIVISPVRPRSCGEYRYWNGFACVDARYNDPYLGPK